MLFAEAEWMCCLAAFWAESLLLESWPHLLRLLYWHYHLHLGYWVHFPFLAYSTWGHPVGHHNDPA